MPPATRSGVPPAASAACHSHNAERARASEQTALNGLLQSAQILIDAGRERDAQTQLQLVPEEARGLVRVVVADREAELKRRIESLIEREYLARDPSDATMYNYLA